MSGLTKTVVAVTLLGVGLLAARAGLAKDPYERPAVAPRATAVNPLLTVVDEAGKSHTFTDADLAKLPQRRARLAGNSNGPEYEGASLVDVLKLAGVDMADGLHGRRTATVALCEAADKYRVALSLIEIDPATTDKWVLVASRLDGKPLGAEEGPYRFVIPDDKRKVRSIRMLQTIRVVNLHDLPMAPETALNKNSG